jgi:nucleoside-diphosphate-sugar epimerase
LRLLVTGAGGFLGSRVTRHLRERGHDVVAVSRPGGRDRTALAEVAPVEADAGGPEVRELIEGCAAVLHFAGVPDPDGARRDPARAARENVGTTLNLLEGCAEHGAGLVYPSSVRAAVVPPPDPYAMSKRLGEEACRLHRAPATVLRLTSVFGPGQLVPEGATGAIAVFAWRALAGEAIVIPGDPRRTRDFVYVDDFAAAVEELLGEERWNETLTVASGQSTPLVEAAELVKAAAGSSSAIETPGGELAAGENESYASGAELAFTSRPLPQSVELYVDWLRRHHPAQGRA